MRDTEDGFSAVAMVEAERPLKLPHFVIHGALSRRSRVAAAQTTQMLGLGALERSLQDGQLVPERHVLRGQGCPLDQKCLEKCHGRF